MDDVYLVDGTDTFGMTDAAVYVEAGSPRAAAVAGVSRLVEGIIEDYGSFNYERGTYVKVYRFSKPELGELFSLAERKYTADEFWVLWDHCGSWTIDELKQDLPEEFGL